MKVSVSEDSVQALRVLGKQIICAIENINESTFELERGYLAIEKDLGKNKDRYAGLINNCTCSVADAVKCIYELVSRLDLAANEMSDYLAGVRMEGCAPSFQGGPNEHFFQVETKCQVLDQGAKRKPNQGGKKQGSSDSSRLPTSKSGLFEGDFGNSLFIPNEKSAVQALAAFGERGVAYIDGHPDFSPFATHETPWGKVNTKVEIGHMANQRNNPKWEYGRRRAGQTYDLACDLGNYNQADLALCDKMLEDYGFRESESVLALESEKLDLCRRIASYRKESELTWHECPDGVTMMLVPTVIHKSCPHSGGVSLKKMLEEYGDVDKSYWD